MSAAQPKLPTDSRSSIVELPGALLVELDDGLGCVRGVVTALTLLGGAALVAAIAWLVSRLV